MKTNFKRNVKVQSEKKDLIYAQTSITQVFQKHTHKSLCCVDAVLVKEFLVQFTANTHIAITQSPVLKIRLILACHHFFNEAKCFPWARVLFSHVEQSCARMFDGRSSVLPRYVA